MRFNPCGYIVDIGFGSYRTPCRFFRDNARIDTVKWALAREDALTFPFESAICNIDYEIDPWWDYPVGEVPGARKTYLRLTAPQGLFSGHFCGTAEDFAQGGLYEPTKPPVRYGSLGWPLCCNPPLAALGGAGGGGLSSVVIRPPLAIGGGGGAGGIADFSPVVYVDDAQGGGEGGGEAGDLLIITDAAEGGGEGGGEAGDVLAFTDAAEGGGEGGGEAGDVFVPPTVTPGTTCATAPTLTIGTTYNFTSAVTPGSQQWVMWSGAPAARVLNNTGIGVTPLAGTFYTGATCGSLGPGTPVTSVSQAIITGTGVVFLQVTNITGGANAWSVQLV